MHLLPNKLPLFAVTGADGSFLDTNPYGKVFDFVSGWNVANLGWQRKEVVEAAVDQLQKQAFSPSWLPHVLRKSLAGEVDSVTDSNFDFFATSSGSEAVETCLKIARLVTKRQRIVAFRNAYHGNTLGCIQLGGNTELFKRHGVRGGADPSLLELPVILDRSAEERVREIFRSDPPPAAIIFEPVFTNPGVLPLPNRLVSLIQIEAREAGALIISDEVGTGFCRTGKWFGFQHYCLSPDLIALGKAMGGGIQALAAVGVHRGISADLNGSEFINTFGWMPVACATGIETIRVLKKINAEAETARKGRELTALLRAALKGVTGVSDVRGLGLEIGIGLDFEFGKIRNLQLDLLKCGVYVEITRVISGLILMPPLTSTDEDLESAAKVIIERILSM